MLHTMNPTGANVHVSKYRHMDLKRPLEVRTAGVVTGEASKDMLPEGGPLVTARGARPCTASTTAGVPGASMRAAGRRLKVTARGARPSTASSTAGVPGARAAPTTTQQAITGTAARASGCQRGGAAVLPPRQASPHVPHTWQGQTCISCGRGDW